MRTQALGISRSFVGIAILATVACGTEPSSQEIESKGSELVPKAYARYRSDLHTLEEAGLPRAAPITIGFAFDAPSERRARALQAAIERETPYRATVQWFKEPREGWSVVGDIPSVVPDPANDMELLKQWVVLGLKHGCEMRSWQPTRDDSRRLSNYR